MKLALRTTAGLGAAALLAATTAVLGGAAAHATTLPWSPDPNDIGSITFYDASGHQVTSGAIGDEPFAAYAVASAAGRAGDTKATLFGATPTEGEAPGQWPNEQLSVSSPYPDASAPAPLNTSTLPVVALTNGTETLLGLTQDQPNTATDAYAGLYELRIKTSGPGQGAGASYDAADILVTGTGATATWSQVGATTATTTSLQVTPGSPAYHGTKVTLTATVSPSPTGSVKFLDGSAVLGTVAVSGGRAVLATTALADGTHKLSAQFVPGSGFGASSSTATTFVVRARTTKTTVSASPRTVKKGKTVTLKAAVSPAAAGTVRFYDGSKLLKAVRLSKGKASFTTKSLKVGSHAIVAKFVPASSADYAASTSAKVVVKVTA